MTDLLTGILGLPTHPLVVHFSVVLLPLSALSLLIAVVWRWWRIRFAGLSVAGLLVATGATVLAKESGERLAEVVGTPQEHAEWAGNPRTGGRGHARRRRHLVPAAVARPPAGS